MQVTCCIVLILHLFLSGYKNSSNWLVLVLISKKHLYQPNVFLNGIKQNLDLEADFYNIVVKKLNIVL